MDDLAQLINASASHQELLENGPPAQPLQFPPPRIGNAQRTTATVHNPVTAEEAQIPNVVYEVGGMAPKRGHWIGRNWHTVSSHPQAQGFWLQPWMCLFWNKELLHSNEVPISS